MKNFRHSLIFIIMLILVAVFYEYTSRYSEFPMTIHHSLSITLNYYQDSMNFLHPQVHNLLGDNGSFIAEFPIISYIVALLYKWFGVHEGLFRLVNFIILGLGLLSLSKMVWRLTGDEMYSFFVPLIVLATPVLGFYAFEFSTSTAALGFFWIGFNFFFKYYEDGKIHHWFWAGLFLLLSGLLNWTFTLMVIPLLIVFILENTGSLYFKPNQEAVFKQKTLSLLPFLLIGGGIVGWLYYVQGFNTGEPSISLLNYQDALGFAFSSIRPGIHLSNQYPFTFEIVGLGISFLLFLWILFSPKHQNRLVYLLTISSLLSLAVYFFLYALNSYEGFWLFYVFAVMVLLAFGIMLKNHWETFFLNWSLKWLIAISVLTTFYFSRTQHFYPLSYLSSQNSASQDTLWTELNQADILDFLAKHEITYPTKVVSTIDFSLNTSLYFYNLKGWTNANNKELEEEAFIRECAMDGAKYWITTMNDALKTQPSIMTENPVANYKHKIFVFDIQHLK